MKLRRRAFVLTVLASGLLALATFFSLRPVSSSLLPLDDKSVRPSYVDRSGEALTISYQNRFNVADQLLLTQIPPTLRAAFICAEDGRFFEHAGIDWKARAKAVTQLFRYGRAVRGASTISEQVVRIITPRARTIWTRWIEGFEAQMLERRFSKDQIFEFYLNQVPFGARRRGVVEAARYYFDRDLSTLNLREQIALAVLVRAPEKLSPRKNPAALERRIDQLAQRMFERGDLNSSQREHVRARLEVRPGREPTEAGHFVDFLHARGVASARGGRVQTTLDGVLQRQIQQALRTMLRRFAPNQISNGAVLVVDHEKGEILAWVNDRSFSSLENESQIDAVRALRQPGSTLKPFVYAQALERGWTAATILEDNDMVRPVGGGLHRYRNYSRTHHGPVRLREALGSSLNIPAVRAAEFVGRADLLASLRDFGFKSLRQSADHYGEGLALGNGEVSLYELVSAYAALARGGIKGELKGVLSLDGRPAQRARPLISAESATIIGDILSDPNARILEFGRGGVLQFPTQTAVKTGTSGGYRDLWAVGYSARFTAGVWMGNLNRAPTRGLTSSQAPAVLLRSVFALLEQRWDGAPLPRRGDIVTRTICAETGALPQGDVLRCRKIDEIFSRREPRIKPRNNQNDAPQILVPSPGIIVARDPRIPDAFERLGLALDRSSGISSVRWYMDSQYVGEAPASGKQVSWPLQEGRHTVTAKVVLAKGDQATVIDVGPVGFTVR